MCERNPVQTVRTKPELFITFCCIIISYPQISKCTLSSFAIFNSSAQTNLLHSARNFRGPVFWIVLADFMSVLTPAHSPSHFFQNTFFVGRLGFTYITHSLNPSTCQVDTGTLQLRLSLRLSVGGFWQNLCRLAWRGMSIRLCCWTKFFFVIHVFVHCSLEDCFWKVIVADDMSKPGQLAFFHSC